MMVFVKVMRKNSVVKVNGCFEDSFIVVCVHKHRCCAVQWQEVSSPRLCPHRQEISQSGLSSASYDSGHDIESVEHQVTVQQ